MKIEYVVATARFSPDVVYYKRYATKPCCDQIAHALETRSLVFGIDRPILTVRGSNQALEFCPFCGTKIEISDSSSIPLFKSEGKAPWTFDLKFAQCGHTTPILLVHSADHADCFVCRPELRQNPIDALCPSCYQSSCREPRT